MLEPRKFHKGVSLFAVVPHMRDSNGRQTVTSGVSAATVAVRRSLVNVLIASIQRRHHPPPRPSANYCQPFLCSIPESNPCTGRTAPGRVAPHTGEARSDPLAHRVQPLDPRDRTVFGSTVCGIMPSLVKGRIMPDYALSTTVVLDHRRTGAEGSEREED